ncbi:glutathione peroxidase [Roseiconus lacunae]|uniref:Glutathione peroxidase n=2 Tax=Roseiconus lacunae TaxID=2605694 RepID=A0ABT7PR99_9BACT|nr:glutathione peroxidase [Roseiconus lacunae]MDM4018980.1 glutathione peroxidase [Roseiconus lacunae]WRQ51786.1 glutathione peroxidase [Stieleria sp. HD01]
MRLILSAMIAFGALTTMASAEKKSDHECALDFEMKNIDGKVVDLEDFEGKVVLIVNTASECGLTPQFAGLESLYQKYKDKGFVVLGFPCNQFGGQDPGSNAEIKQYCTSNYSVSFPMFSKVEVNDDGACDLYKYLTSKETKPKGAGSVSWNFEKFLVDRDGQLIARFAPPTKPDAKELVSAIEAEL